MGKILSFLSGLWDKAIKQKSKLKKAFWVVITIFSLILVGVVVIPYLIKIFFSNKNMDVIVIDPEAKITKVTNEDEPDTKLVKSGIEEGLLILDKISKMKKEKK